MNMKRFTSSCYIIYEWIQALYASISSYCRSIFKYPPQRQPYQRLQYWPIDNTTLKAHNGFKMQSHIEPMAKQTLQSKHILFNFNRLQIRFGWMMASLISCIIITGCQNSRSLLAPEAINQLQGTAVMVISSDVQLRIANKSLENRLLDLINNRQQLTTKKLIITLSYSSNITDIRGGGVTDRYRLTLVANYRLIGPNDTVITSGLVSNTGNYETDLNYYRDSQARYEAMRDLINELAQLIYYRLLKHYYP